MPSGGFMMGGIQAEHSVGWLSQGTEFSVACFVVFMLSGKASKFWEDL